MNENEIREQIDSCIECEACLEVCDTYLVSHDILRSPNGRLKISGKIFDDEEISGEELKAIYTCTLCSLCDDFCQQEIPISEIIHSSKIKLVEQNLGPLEIHDKITQGIIEKGNSVNGDPEERLSWIPDEYRKNEIFEQKNSNTLLFLGCMSSFRVQESASASYTLLKKGGYDFKILEKEPCCGEYVYSSGNLKLAKQMFKENFDTFKTAGIKTIITTCAGCLYAFNNVYPKFVSDWDIEVKHVIQVIHELFINHELKFKKLRRGITYHDPCRTGRKLKELDIYDEPRELLQTSCENYFELPKNREITPCCGAGSGVRGVDSNLCINIGLSVLNDSSTKELITACPLCAFNYRYIIYKEQLDKEIKYITDYLLEALD
jgi:Fe-S oxidoreductase